MAVDQLGPAEMLDQAIGGGELHPQHPLGLLRRQGVEVGGRERHVHGGSPPPEIGPV
jgi:hypothetical protein